MLRSGFKAAAFNITGFILILGSFYFIDLEGIQKLFGYLSLVIGLIHLVYIIYTYYLYRKLSIPSHLLLYAGSACIFIMALFRISIENWETPALLVLLSLFVFLCAKQIQGRLKFFPKPKEAK